MEDTHKINNLAFFIYGIYEYVVFDNQFALFIVMLFKKLLGKYKDGVY